ncbi:hypothetical protein [Klebsiella pneumoniae]|uniref:hypothetical protein n=1 Tax=Klebsiella pneumoniae TaxID=573 RepID=UPI0039858BB4
MDKEVRTAMTDLPAMRQPKQDRSRVALERLMAASREILHEGTFELLTIAEISKRFGRFCRLDLCPLWWQRRSVYRRHDGGDAGAGR